jgi:hypothetical protein
VTKRKPLTEAQWLNAEEPDSLLSYLEQHQVITRVPGGRRRLALFACACCRLVWHLFEDEASRRAVEVSERAAEGQASRQELAAAEAEAEVVRRGAGQHLHRVMHRENHTRAELWRAGAANLLAQGAHNAAARRFTVMSAEMAAVATATAVAWLAGGPEAGQQAMRALMARQAQLVRCIFGNPFRPLPSLDPAWLTWNGGAVRKLAVSIHAERRFGDLPVLADALEEAGCAAEAILRHCRDGGEHAPGCWVLDLLLGRSDGAGR